MGPEFTVVTSPDDFRPFGRDGHTNLSRLTTSQTTPVLLKKSYLNVVLSVREVLGVAETVKEDYKRSPSITKINVS